MRRAYFILTITALALLFVAAEGVAAPRTNPNQGLFQETGYDFKGIPRYTMPRHSFVFVNNGQDELRLLSARVSCQCTKVFIPEKRVYKPGEKGEVVAQIDGVRFTGVRHVTVTVVFQRGANIFEAPLNVSGVILENVSLQPQSLNFLVDQKDPKAENAKEGDKASAKERTQTVQVVYPGYNETVARVVSSSPYVDVKVGKPVRVANGVQTPLVVSIKDSAPAGYVNSVVHLWSNGVNGGTPLTLNVTGVVRAPLAVSPRTLAFPTAENGERIVKNIVVTASSDFTLKSVQSSSKAIDCTFPKKAARPTRVCVVPIAFHPEKLTDEPEKAKITIETTDGRTLSLDAQISSGNFALAKRDKESASPNDDKTTVVASASENKSDESPDDDFSDAKVSVSGIVKTEAASAETSDSFKESVDDSDAQIERKTSELNKTKRRGKDVTPLTLSNKRGTTARRYRPGLF